jgi:hypothetical protein
MKWREFLIFVPLGILAIMVYNNFHKVIVWFFTYIGGGQ